MLQLAGASAASSALLRPAFAASDTPLRTALTPADYGDVTLLDGPLREQFRAQHATLLAMDEDSLLKPFRAAAGLPTPGEDLGGWYTASPSFNPPADMHGYIPGHSFGQYVSSLARAYAVTGDAATREKVGRLLAGFAPTITPRFYEGYPLPAYTFDKINIGLIDAYAFAGERSSLHLLDRAIDAALPHLPEKALTRPEMAARPHPNVSYTWDESYTLPENLFLAWRRGAGERYHGLAARFLQDRDYFDPLARGENVLPGLHAYSHVNALNSAMQAYLVLRSEKHLQAAKNGFDFVRAQSFATGGWGPNEGFVTPGSGALGQSLFTTHASFETPCGAYGHFKITRNLLSVTGDSTYGDSMERVLYNTVLGALPMKPDGTAFYYSDYNDTGAKTYYDLKCSCCSGTLGQVVADYGISSYLTSERGIAVNLYVPSRFRWRRSGRAVTLEQTTAYPLGSDVSIAVKTPTPETFSISLRIPAWSGPNTTLAVNDKAVDGPVMPGRFHEIRREWHDGDRIALVLDRPLRLEAVDEKHPDLVALMQGPLALFAVGQRLLPFRRRELLSAQQVAAGSTEWRVATVDGTQTFKPFYAIDEGTTRLYQTVSA
ncbi:MAG TPA: beta-L-arabinofuranosidase domain-containing protein [Rhizomicrobium sp.]|nr:beta-L-arabinofuranosidase domain-containing protein [Rhizomicrobium sp.]